MSRRKRGLFLITTGLLMTVLAAGLFGVYEYRAEQAGRNAQLLLTELTRELDGEPLGVQSPVETVVPEGEMAQCALDGYDLVGVVSVPAVGVELPVLERWSYDLLQLTPCRYSGTPEGDDLILLGHNYKKHFAPLKRAAVGDAVEFRDVTGTVHRYQVTQTEVLQPTELDRLTAPGHDLTLFTCTNGGRSRFVVRCDRMETEEKSG